MNFPFVKRATASDNLLLFLVAAAASVLLTRFFLYLTDYPQITTGSIHLAHIIFGGSILSVSSMVLLTFQGKRARQFSAVLAGFGFGLFIDELGKFITVDNDYFFQPAPVIIYLTFIILFFIYRYFDKYTPHQPKEIFYELLENLEEIGENNFYARTKRNIEEITEKLRRDSRETYHLFAEGIEHTILKLPYTDVKKPRSYVQKIRSSWQWLDEFTTERQPVFYFLLLIFAVYIINSFISTGLFVQSVIHRDFNQATLGVDNYFEVSLIAIQLVFQFISAAVMTQGFLSLIRRKKQRALEHFKNGLALNILVIQVVNFYFQQFSASAEMLLILAMFFIIHNILEEEKN